MIPALPDAEAFANDVKEAAARERVEPAAVEEEAAFDVKAAIKEFHRLWGKAM